jgi:ribose transport system permease protein
MSITSTTRASAGKRVWASIRDSSAFGVLIAFILLFIVFSILHPRFISPQNFRNLAVSISTLGLVAAGVTLVLLVGMLDVSTEAVLAMSSVVLGFLMAKMGLPAIVGIFGAIAVGAAIGVINGLITVRFKINPVITTLATLAIFTGVAQVTSGMRQILINAPRGTLLWYFGFGSVFGIPIQLLVVLAVYVLLWFVLQHTPFGRNVYAVGGNPAAANMLGINVARYRFLAFVINGAAAGLASVLISARALNGWPGAGQGFLFGAITAVVLGGTSLAGGRGGAWQTLLAVLLLGTLTNGLNLLQVHPYWQGVASGVLLLLAVGVELLRNRLIRKRYEQ